MSAPAAAAAGSADAVRRRSLDEVFAAHASRWIVGACLVYLGLEILYVLRLPFVMDEFQGAAAIERLSHDVPYRDFRPYKSVLGYYLQWPALQLGTDLVSRMLAVKLATAAVTAVAVALAARRLCRRLAPGAVVLALLMLVSMSTFLERSAALRVDMPTALFGLFSLLALLDGRVGRAGALAGISFLVSQKGVYYAAAGGAALGLEWAFASRSRDRFVDALRFAASAAAPPLLYLAIFALVASGAVVGEGVLLRPRRIAFDDLYQLRHFWLQTLSRNPAFYAVMGLALISLAARWRAGSADATDECGLRDRRLLGYGAVLLASCLWHKQPWPYFFVLLVPTGFVLAARFFDLEIERRGRLGTGLVAACVGMGVIWPLTRVPRVLERDAGFQRHMMSLAEHVLDADDRYLAGLDFVYTHRQVHGLAWLDGPRLAALACMTPEELALLSRRVGEARPKLVVWNYRIAKLPEPLLRAIHGTYAPLFGNLQIYSPALPPGESWIELWHSGRYALSGPGGVEIDGRLLEAAAMVELAEGVHQVRASAGHRLHLVPEGVEERALARHAQPRPLFENVYTY